LIEEFKHATSPDYTSMLLTDIAKDLKLEVEIVDKILKRVQANKFKSEQPMMLRR